MSRFSRDLYAFAMLTSSVMGVGFFSLPYIAAKVGLPVMLTFMIFLFVFALVEHLMFVEVTLKTPDYKRFPGFVRHYLGRPAEKISYFTTIITSFLALVAYIIVGGGFLYELVSPIFGHSQFFYSFIYFLLGAILVSIGVSVVSRVSLFTLFSFLGILFMIFFSGWPHFSLANLQIKIGEARDLFLPYGAIIFSLWGLGLAPEAEEFLKNDKKDLRKIMPWALLLPFLIYLFFIIFVLGVSGSNVSESALVGLGENINPSIFTFALILGLLSTFNGFTTMGLTLKKVLHYDMGLSKILAWGLACIVPFILYMSGLKNFIWILGFVGGVVMAIEGIMVLMMYKKIKPDNFWVYPMALIFMLGIICEIIKLMG